MKVLGKIVLVLVILYVTSYIVLRSRWTRTWDKDGKRYMHFPVSPGWVYYLFRPLSTVDGEMSGTQFHIGPHPGTEPDVLPSSEPGNTPAPAPEAK